MKIYLHNPAHNGDIFHTTKITEIFIKSNPNYEFILVPSCSSILFKDLLCERVTLMNHPCIWESNINKHISNNIITSLHNDLWNIYENNLYINMWLLYVKFNKSCVTLVKVPEMINNILKSINNELNTNIQFDCTNYKELIPKLPEIDIDENIMKKLKEFNKKIVLFYNHNGCSGFYTPVTNDEIINYLVQKYSENEYIILLVKKDNTRNLLSLESAFGIVPHLDGSNLVETAYIANECSYVYFKPVGGSQFILNQQNINNSDKVNYNFIGDYTFFETFTNEYGLICNYVNIEEIRRCN